MRIHPVFLFLIILFFPLTALAQAETVHFEYDAAGNRTARYVFRNMNAEETDSILEAQDQLAPLLKDEPEEEPKAAAEGFVLSPNPTRDYVIINHPTLPAEDDWEYRLYSSGGVLMQQGVTRRFPIELDFSSISRGTYYLRLSTDEQGETFSIIKM